MKKTIVVIAEERELKEGTNILSVELDFSSKYVTQKIITALQEKGYCVSCYHTPEEFLDVINKHKSDIAFAALWGGQHSRNKRGLIASICEAYHIKYIGADTYVQILCQDKYMTKLFLKDSLFALPKAIVLKDLQDLHLLEDTSLYPCIIKPNDEGCSVGISDHSVVNNPEEAYTLAKLLLTSYMPLLAEEFISGREISICLAGTKDHIEVCEAVELLLDYKPVNDRVWGYESKKSGACVVTRKVVTDEIPNTILKEAKRIFNSLGKVDLMRIDGKFKDGKFYVIELSPDCSLHDSCFMSTAFHHNHYTYAEMLEKLIEIGLSSSYNDIL